MKIVLIVKKLSRVKKTTLSVFILFFVFKTPLVWAQSDIESGVLKRGYDFVQANLCQLNLCIFGTPRSLSELAFVLMGFLGVTIIFASIMGVIIGGGFWVISGRNESRVSRGKDIMIASVIGLVIVFCSYLVVQIVQSVFYSI